jgi:hypothetical protein
MLDLEFIPIKMAIINFFLLRNLGLIHELAVEKTKKYIITTALKLKTLVNEILTRVFSVVPPGIEPGTHGFSVHCSTN